MRLYEELSFLSALPEALTERLATRGQGSSPPLVIVYLSSLKVRVGPCSFRGFVFVSLSLVLLLVLSLGYAPRWVAARLRVTSGTRELFKGGL